MPKTPKEIISNYNTGLMNRLELLMSLQEILCKDNIDEIMILLLAMKNREHALRFIEHILDLIAAIDRDDIICTWNGADLTDKDKSVLRERLSCMITYTHGE